MNSSVISLNDKWTFWYMMRSNKGSVQANNYKTNIHPIGTFSDSTNSGQFIRTCDVKRFTRQQRHSLVPSRGQTGVGGLH